MVRDDVSQRQFVRHTWPFGAVAFLAEVSLFLPPGPTSRLSATLSAVLLAMSALTIVVLWRRLPPWSRVVAPLLYVGSVLCLILSIGGSTSGVGLVVLLPIVWTAFNLTPWDSAVVVVAVAALQVVTSIVPTDVTNAIRLRRVSIYLIIGALLVYSIHELLIRLSRVSAQREAVNADMALTIEALNESNRNARELNKLADLLNTCTVDDEAYVVMEHSAIELFVGGGSMCVLNSSKDLMEMKCAWGGYAKSDTPFSPADCWAVRRGHVYESGPGDLTCKHVALDTASHTLCRPLVAQGEVIGIFTVSLGGEVRDGSIPEDAPSDIRRYALMASEQISVWMANYKLRDRLRNLAIRDPLTNLFNRRFMEETLERELSSAIRTQDEISILQIDVDHFKNFNDTYGHALGDRVLCGVADVILGLFRGVDVPCRSGGEEFTLVLPHCSGDTAVERATELQRRIALIEIPVTKDHALPTPPTISVGVATSSEHGFASDALLHAADLALYSAKNAGRNRIVRAPAVSSPSEESTTTT